MRTNQKPSPPSYRIVRGASGLWEVMEEGIRGALALFRAPQAALSYACALAEAHKGSVVVVFHKLPLGLPLSARNPMSTMGPGSASLQ